MLKIIVRYLGFNTDVGFLRIKQQYVSNTFWLSSFYIHSFSAIFTLFAGFTQFSNQLRSNHIKLHKVFGKIYVYTVLFLTAPTGLVLGIYANGHLPSKIGFCLLAVLWFIFTLKAVQHIKRGHITKHRAFMIRSYALALSAITLRIWKFGLANTIEPDPMDLYQLVTWLGFIPNLLIAEWIVYRLDSNPSDLTKKNS
ncbi:MAG: putative membrane protein [Bacteroidia bacterium]|jgi:uncharacterized membrane protein